MPNAHNIESPITLISYGRSGSSLLSNVFELHPDFSVVGETGNFIANLWTAYEVSSGQIAPSIKDEKWISDDERAGGMVRASFLSCFPDDKKQWFHKPIGVPNVLSSKLSEEQWDEEQLNESAIWYWNIINSTFPKGRFFTVLRHPLDVVLSAKSYWGFDESSIWKNYGIMSYLLSHPLSPVEYAISYEELVLDRASTVKSLFEFLEVPFYEEVMHAFSVVHAASPGRECIRTNLVTRKDEWAKLGNSNVNPRNVDMVLRMFDRYQKPMTLPVETYNNIRHEYNNRRAGVINDDPANQRRIDQVISEKNKTIELINANNSRKALQREREVFEMFNEDQKWISELEKGKLWLTLENDDLRKHIEILQEGIVWQAAQRDAWEQLASQRETLINALQAIAAAEKRWEQTAAEREQTIGALDSRLQETLERLAASDAVLYNIRTHWGMRFVKLLSRTKRF
jgi:hypothetical protein